MIKIGISIGDINGIGLEIILKTFADNRMLNRCIPIIYASTQVVEQHLKTLGELANEIQIHKINDASKAEKGKINLLNCWNDNVNIEFGKSTKIAGKYALLSLQYAVDDLKTNKTNAIVTAPINKHNIQSDTFKFVGHTEYLQDQFDASENLMFLVGDTLKVGIVTGHIPLKEVANTITEEKIIAKLRLMAQSLKQDFSIDKPKIAVMGLNPHAGDNGLIGKEEQTTIRNAIDRANSELANFAFGPYPPDGFFGAAQYLQFDAVLAMYHDQGLIPFKTLCFESGVNFTAGLPIVRTSPDHGTSYDIAGKNKANPNSFRCAVYQAIYIYQNRNENIQLEHNALVPVLNEENGFQRRKREDPI